MYLDYYKNCIYCSSEKLTKNKNQESDHNFYTEAIKQDLEISDKLFSKMKVYKCNNCNIIQNNPWFKNKIAKKIFSEIYGQHNRNWSNLINFFRHGKKPNHGNLIHYINKNFKIKNYAEFNSPFMGLMIDFFSLEYKKDLKFYKNLFTNTLSYLKIRQLAGQEKNYIKKSKKNASSILKKIKNLKKDNLIKKDKKKYLVTDNSYLTWGENDNYKSVNSKTLASNLFEIDIMDINQNTKSLKFDCFGIFHTLDHTHQPKKILDIALKLSKRVIVYCHINEKLEKQHLFSITKEFLNYLERNNIYTRDLTEIIEKKNNSPELYFLCSRKKKYI